MNAAIKRPYQVEATGKRSSKTGRPRYKIVCARPGCGALVHDATQDPEARMNQHDSLHAARSLAAATASEARREASAAPPAPAASPAPRRPAAPSVEDVGGLELALAQCARLAHTSTCSLGNPNAPSGRVELVHWPVDHADGGSQWWWRASCGDGYASVEGVGETVLGAVNELRRKLMHNVNELSRQLAAAALAEPTIAPPAPAQGLDDGDGGDDGDNEDDLE